MSGAESSDTESSGIEPSDCMPPRASQPGAAQSGAYDAHRRTPRKHKRVVFHGTERFDADGVKLEPGDMLTDTQRAADDDRRILGELPPHWAVFNAKR